MPCCTAQTQHVQSTSMRLGLIPSLISVQHHVSVLKFCPTCLQSPDTLKTISAPFGAKLEVLSPDETLPVSVLRTEPKSMTVREVKSMSLEQHVVIWKVTPSPASQTSSSKCQKWLS